MGGDRVGKGARQSVQEEARSSRSVGQCHLVPGVNQRHRLEADVLQADPQEHHARKTETV